MLFLDLAAHRYAVREFANKSAASAASPDYVKFKAMTKSAASAASLRGGRASGRLDHICFPHVLTALAAKQIVKNVVLGDLYIRIPTRAPSGAGNLHFQHQRLETREHRKQSQKQVVKK